MHRAAPRLAAVSLGLVSLWLACPAPALGQGDVYLKAPRYKKDKLVELLESEMPEPGQLKILEDVARSYVYEVTSPDTQSKPGEMDKAVKAAELTINEIFKRKKTTAVVRQEFGKQMQLALRQVLENDRQPVIAKLNAARILAPLLADSGQEELVPTALALLQNPNESDAVKLYALRGLKAFLALGNAPMPVVFKDKKLEGQCIVALVQFIERKPAGVSDRTPTDELDGLRYVRREAIRALAEVRAPVLPDNKDAHAALTLLRVVRGYLDAEGKTPLVPSPRIDEQVEAAIGLAKMRSALAKDYQPDYAAYHIAYFVGQFGLRYTNRKDNKEERRPWLIYAARLTEALEAMGADSKDPYVQKAVPEALRVLIGISETMKGDRGSDLLKWVRTNPRRDGSLFKGAPDTAVPPPADRTGE
jgi:hypothetical protein